MEPDASLLSDTVYNPFYSNPNDAQDKYGYKDNTNLFSDEHESAEEKDSMVSVVERKCEAGKSYHSVQRNDDSFSDSQKYCKVDQETIATLKSSTRKLLSLLEDIQSKVQTKKFEECILRSVATEKYPSVTGFSETDNVRTSDTVTVCVDIIGSKALKTLQVQTQNLEAIYLQEDYDDCSVYKRLTRKCHCLNQQEYNDLMIHFNEDTKYFTSTLGEIIKNMRIVKRFLYMGGDYTKHALLFLNEGLEYATHSEKVDIIVACSHADVCNVFEDRSIAIVCISMPCKYEVYGDARTQAMAASFLHKISQMEEGRRYLNYNTKITNDIKTILVKKAALIEFDTLEKLDSTMKQLHPTVGTIPSSSNTNKAVFEGITNNTINALSHHARFMTLHEVFNHLDVLKDMSHRATGKTELTMKLPILLKLFKKLLADYDSDDMNIVVTRILNSVLDKCVPAIEPDIKMVDPVDTEKHKEVVVKRNAIIQFPPILCIVKRNNAKIKSKLLIVHSQKRGQSSKKEVNKERNRSLPRVTNRSQKFQIMTQRDRSMPRVVNRSQKFQTVTHRERSAPRDVNASRKLH